MYRHRNLMTQVTPQFFVAAAERASTDHIDETEVKAFMTDLQRNCEWLYHDFKDGTYTKLLVYRQLQKTNNNGKVRDIDSPSFVTRVFQYVFMLIAEPLYYAIDPNLGLNCKPEHGITAKKKEFSVLHRLKNVYYDKRQYHYVLIMDQRKCYEHITVKVFRRKLRRLVDDTAFVDFAVNVCFVNGHLPVGTPTSPLVHHVIMLPFDLWLKKEASQTVRYADDNIIPCRTIEEAQALKWRIKNVWWYELGIRAKRSMTKIVPLRKANDFCGYILHRNAGKTVCSRNKGYVSIRNSTYERASKSTNKNWGSYFGIMKHADVFRAMLKIEKEMNLRELTDKIKINRSMDAPTIAPKELVDRGIVFTVYDYEIRKDAKGNPNWIKILLGYTDTDENGDATGREVAREFHGAYMNIIAFHVELEKHYSKKALLPLTGCVLENSCGYIYQNSTNQINYISEYEKNLKQTGSTF